MVKQEMAAGRATGDRNSNFPVGMRVLAVDDDPTCLMLLDTLLRRCQYHVTTTSQAVMALKMLQENKNMFDLVISDVHMPDMDGFKLLELVGLEMDVPVIMLSAYGDKEHVMKGITHGACDYLLKPVRIEELKNIWQHVIRRKKIDTNNQKTSDKPNGDFVEAVEGSMGIGDSDHIGQITRKRKDQNGDEYDEHSQEGNNNEDPAMQKKPRLVWTPNLHRKFVEAVNVLGIDKAFPKRILEMMNEETLTREKVASHLQKFRGYLKKISAAPNQEVNMVSVLGRTDSASLGRSLNGFGDLYNLEVSRPIQNASFRSFSPGSVLGRLNSPGLGLLGLSSSGAIQLDHAQNSTSPITDMTNFQSLMRPENQNGNVLQGVPLPLETLSVSSNESKIYPISTVFSNGRKDVGSSSNSLLCTENNPMPVETQLHCTQMGGIFENQPSVVANSLSSECSQSLDVGGFNENWLNAVQSSHIYSNFQQTTLSNTRDISPMAMDIGTYPHAQLADVRTNLHCQAAMISSNGRQSINFTPTKEWDDHEDHTSYLSNLMYSSMVSSIDASSMDQRFDSGSLIYTKSGCKLVGQSNCLNPIPMQYNEVEQPTEQKAAELSYGNLKEQSELQGGYAYCKVDSLEDLVNVATKEGHKLDLKEGDFGCDAYSLSVGT